VGEFGGIEETSKGVGRWMRAWREVDEGTPISQPTDSQIRKRRPTHYKLDWRVAIH
jgi:hypothetical protein